MKKIWALYLKQPWEKKILWSATGLSLVPIAAGIAFSYSKPPPERTANTRAEVDTYIPKGFVLVPIEVQNYEALDSILGQFGVVDLFQSASPENPGQHLVARNVRILRAPQNPSHFAILVQEGEVGIVLKNTGPFTVVVRRPEKNGTEFVKEDERPVLRTIVYEKE